MSDKSYVGLAACPICGEDSGVLLNRRLQNTFENGKRYALNCAKCESVLKVGGVWMIEVKDDAVEGPNPFRTGYIVGMSEQWQQRTGAAKVNFVRESDLKEMMGDQYKVEVDNNGQRNPADQK